MKNLKQYITEKLKITKDNIGYGHDYSPITKKELPEFVDNLYNCLDTTKPTNDKEEYIAVYFNSSRYLEISDTYYINIDDLENHTDKDSVLTIFYNLAKRVNNKYIGAGIMMWDPTRNDYCEFAHASLRANDRMWELSYIKLDKHPFI